VKSNPQIYLKVKATKVMIIILISK